MTEANHKRIQRAEQVLSYYEKLQSDVLAAFTSIECETSDVPIILCKLYERRSDIHCTGWGDIAMFLVNRCGRGTTTIDTALDRFIEVQDIGIAEVTP